MDDPWSGQVVVMTRDPEGEDSEMMGVMSTLLVRVWESPGVRFVHGEEFWGLGLYVWVCPPLLGSFCIDGRVWAEVRSSSRARMSPGCLGPRGMPASILTAGFRDSLIESCGVVS